MTRSTLGTYQIPNSLDYIGVAAYGSKTGEDDQSGVGLQPNFWRAICSWRQENANLAFPNFTAFGFMSMHQMDLKASNNQRGYYRYKYLFGTGLAYEYEPVSVDTALGGDISVALADNILNMYGLAKVTTDEICFICPQYYVIDPAYDKYGKVVYAGDRLVNDNLTEFGDGGAMFYSSLFTQWQDSTEAELHNGIRAFANDTDVWSDVKSLLNASMRSVQSLPDGSIAAFYPDMWGKAGVETPVITIPQIELRSIKVSYDESQFASHVYCNPVTIGTNGSKLQTRYTIGAVGIESDSAAVSREALANSTGTEYLSTRPAEILRGMVNIPAGHEYEYSPAYLIGRYGFRATTVQNTSGVSVVQMGYESRDSNPQYIMPFLLALYTFMEHWANMKKVDVEITYNPFIWPGCRITFEGMGLTVFVKQVTHTMNYGSGFTTSITAVAPVGNLVEGMVQ